MYLRHPAGEEIADDGAEGQEVERMVREHIDRALASSPRLAPASADARNARTSAPSDAVSAEAQTARRSSVVRRRLPWNKRAESRCARARTFPCACAHSSGSGTCAANPEDEERRQHADEENPARIRRAREQLAGEAGEKHADIHRRSAGSPRATDASASATSRRAATSRPPIRRRCRARRESGRSASATRSARRTRGR